MPLPSWPWQAKQRPRKVFCPRCIWISWVMLAISGLFAMTSLRLAISAASR
jgi:hypothetical protein